MYFVDINILIKQILPPSWRYVKVPDGDGGFEDKETGKFFFIKAILKPFDSLLSEFKDFRKSTKSKINLTPQVMVMEHHIKNITSLDYGVYISDVAIGHFKVNVPDTAIAHENEILIFLNNITPIGRRYELNFY